MIWGCQWDATLNWMQTSTDENVKNFVTNSSGKGNHSDVKLSYKTSDTSAELTQSSAKSAIPTGGADITKVNNIYDMAGNMYEYGIEASSIRCRTKFGGVYNYLGNVRAVNFRNSENNPEDKLTDSGSRATLYINP